MVLDNDVRGWVMAVVSGIACTFGASIICVDLIIRQIPGQKNFKIEDSNAFLSSGLSLSFGVMIFSSLYSMLPSAKKYLVDGGLRPGQATLTMIGCFLFGALVISVLSRILHKYIPHEIVDCDHEHGDEEAGKAEEEDHPHQHSHGSHPRQNHTDRALENHHHGTYGTNDGDGHPRQASIRPSLHTTISSKVTQLVNGAQKSCDETGKCYGFSDTCGTDCFQNVMQARPPRVLSIKSTSNLVSSRVSIGGRQSMLSPTEPPALSESTDETTPLVPARSVPTSRDGTATQIASINGHPVSQEQETVPLQKHSRSSSISSATSGSSHDEHGHDHNTSASQHHHHVPTNVFLSIGLQTSTAIALHKIPEGFITYATNHANPTLGFSIFLALFIHNITEGFAMALPLYLAINSRWKAMFWSALLGGVSQPLGAGVAALWFKLAGRGKHQADAEPGDVVYGCMFAVTAGIMAMVSLQLLGESLDLTHSRRLCFISALAGMGILGLSSALTA